MTGHEVDIWLMNNASWTLLAIWLLAVVAFVVVVRMAQTEEDEE